MAKVTNVSLGVERDMTTNLCYIIVVVKIEFTARESMVLADPTLGPDYFTLTSTISGLDPDPGGSGTYISTEILDLDDVPISDPAREQTIRIEKTVGCELLNESPEEGQVDEIVADVDLHNNDIDLANEGQSEPFAAFFQRP